jgi:outer membrane protein TolC
MERSPAAFAAHRIIGMLGVTALCVAPLLASAADVPLTLPEAQRQAVERSQLLVARYAAIAGAREMAIAAAQLPDPVAKMQINNLPIDGEDRFSLTRDFMTMRSIGVMQEFTRSDKRKARAERFERDADKSNAESVLDTATIQRDTALAWLDRYYAESMAAVVAEQRLAAVSEIEAAEGAYRAGRGSLADILAARSALVGFDDRASEFSRRASAATINLARWIGDGARAPLAGKPDIDTLRVDIQSLDADIRHHPQIALLDQREAIAAADVKIAQAAKQVDWSLEVMYSQRGSAYSNMISLELSVPLQWDRPHRQEREVTAKLAMLDEVRAEREDMLRAYAAELPRDARRVGEQPRAPQPLSARAAAARRGAYAGHRRAYRGAKASIADVLMARRGEIDVRTQTLQLEWDTARLWAQLNFLTPDDGASRTNRTLSRSRQ